MCAVCYAGPSRWRSVSSPRLSTLCATLRGLGSVSRAFCIFAAARFDCDLPMSSPFFSRNIEDLLMETRTGGRFDCYCCCCGHCKVPHLVTPTWMCVVHCTHTRRARLACSNTPGRCTASTMCCQGSASAGCQRRASAVAGTTCSIARVPTPRHDILFLAAVLTDTYLCQTCSYQHLIRRTGSARGSAGRVHRAQQPHGAHRR